MVHNSCPQKAKLPNLLKYLAVFCNLFATYAKMQTQTLRLKERHAKEVQKIITIAEEQNMCALKAQIYHSLMYITPSKQISIAQLQLPPACQ